MEDVTDDKVLEGMRLLASTEGIFAETAGGVTVASLRKAVADGRVERGERTVAVISGNGLKTIEAIADTLGPTCTITGRLDEFEQALTLEEGGS
jgi:threonine synthase